MALGEVVEEQPNFVIVRDLLGNKVLYDKIKNTFYNADPSFGAWLESRMHWAGRAYTRMPAAAKWIVEGVLNRFCGVSGIEPIKRRLDQKARRVRFAVKEDLMETWLREPMPHITFELTRECNFGPCRYCKVLGGNYAGCNPESAVMNEQTAMTALTEFSRKAAKSPAISFYGGEPALALPLLKKIVARSEELFKSPTFTVTTNMSIAGEFQELLLEHHFSVLVSLDGPKHIHDRNRPLRGGGGTFDIVMENVSHYLSRCHNPAQDVAFSVVISNPSEIGEVRRFFNERFPNNNVMVSSVAQGELVNECLRFKADDIKISNTEMKKMAQEYIAALREGKPPDRFLEVLFLKELKDMFEVQPGVADESILPDGVCIPSKRHLFVTAEGDYVPCNEIPKGFLLGRVEQGVDDRLIAKGLQEMIQVRNELCVDCYAQRICRPCFKHAIRDGRMEKAGLESSCTGLKKYLVEAISLFSVVSRSVPVEHVQKYINEIELA